ncbi:hypothetical protein CC1G_15534 [Coprinopsis cinerea okayama7|uniref:NYN domain-containing protein n=1 Tax=Coprinopsis cinerea (strain Okayama-7 / 130 / ATCC MYA-4618 / FGSC 9003) TaxID=240176 RepID=D6RN22_COPC7|nr:hypothetical protein CC1G_15534 [Coprinopsis cinerea okayama7\|eukprot:XP_002910993.1 hypothetical protein CC1G_15534 [Coprinopsis cinerea okayama7\
MSASMGTIRPTNSVGFFWDFENLPPKNFENNGYGYPHAFREIGEQYGSIKEFKAYLQIATMRPARRDQFQAMGMTLVDCEHAGRKEVVDKMMIDMILFACDNPAPATVVVVSEDRDYSYAVATLCLRGYDVVLIRRNEVHPGMTIHSATYRTWDSVTKRAELLAKKPVRWQQPTTRSNPLNVVQAAAPASKPRAERGSVSSDEFEPTASSNRKGERSTPRSTHAVSDQTIDGHAQSRSKPSSLGKGSLSSPIILASDSEESEYEFDEISLDISALEALDAAEREAYSRISSTGPVSELNVDHEDDEEDEEDEDDSQVGNRSTDTDKEDDTRNNASRSSSQPPFDIFTQARSPRPSKRARSPEDDDDSESNTKRIRYSDAPRKVFKRLVKCLRDWDPHGKKPTVKRVRRALGGRKGLEAMDIKDTLEFVRAASEAGWIGPADIPDKYCVIFPLK